MKLKYPNNYVLYLSRAKLTLLQRHFFYRISRSRMYRDTFPSIRSPSK